jgi:hypothetical protein
MRISEKIEVDYDDDSFVGFERSSKLFAVVVRGLGHDHKAVAEKIQWICREIGVLGARERMNARMRNVP